MLTVPLIVNHKNDPDKQNGLVTSTFSYLGQLPDGSVQLLNINLVVWPNIPSPLHHQEADADLEFVSVYDMNNDEEDEEDEDEDGLEFTDEDDEEFQDDAEELVVSSTTTTIVEDGIDAEAPNN